jgi:Tfp pilus assembly protein PilV
MMTRSALSARSTRPVPPCVVTGQAGLTVMEVVAAAAILTIAVVALLSSITAGFTSVDLGRLQSNAVFLAEQRLEEVRGFAVSTAANQGFVNVTSASFPAEGYGAIANNPAFRRTVTVTDNPAGVANTKRVDVVVFFRPQTTTGLTGETAVTVSTLITPR